MNTANPHVPAVPGGASSRSPLDAVRAGAGRCVACGLCLPHCPTFGKTRSELESPRGRIALMLALAKRELVATPKLESHLSLCLGCRSCEAVCPAQVPFGEVMDAARSHLSSRPESTFRRTLLPRALALLAHPLWLAGASILLRVYQRSGLQWLLRQSRLLKVLGLARVEAQLPSLERYFSSAVHYPAHGTQRGVVALFAGCVARLTDATTLHDSIHVLTRLGYAVHVPPAQGCCGALHQHAGDAAGAERLMRRNLAAFAGDAYSAVVVSASGCAATLIEYTEHSFRAKVTDLSSFLQRIEWPADVQLKPLVQRIVVQDPCTLTNVLRTPQAPYELLRRIPQAEVMALPGNKTCCGAAGAYHLEHPRMADSLRDDKIEQLRHLAPNILVSSNIGCAMHLASGIRTVGLSVEVVHPVSLIARQLGT